MKIKINYLDNMLEINNDSILCLEIGNKRYFYRIIENLYGVANTEPSEEVIAYDNSGKEINISSKIKIFINFFNFDFDSKRYSTDINKYVIGQLEETDKTNLLKSYNRLIDTFLKILNKSDLPLQIMEEITIENIIKNLKLSISPKNDLLNNLLLLIELERILKTNNLLIFINLKQYLSDEELNELYKYALYNSVNLLMIDSQCYKNTNEYEKKIIIDSNLDEFVV